jgi:hypothetical protein
VFPLECRSATLPSRKQLVELLEHVFHARCHRELAHPLANASHIGLRMRFQQSFNVLQILWAARNRLHDQQVLDSRQSDGNPGDVVSLAVLDGILLECKPTERDIDVDPVCEE